jgi:hypothetical protein
MPVDNRNFIIEDLPSDPEDSLFPEDDDDDDVIRELEEDNDGEEIFQRPNPATSFTRTAPWERPATFQPVNPWGSSWGQSRAQTPSQPGNERKSYDQTGTNRIPRKKKIIFVDLLDILIESESAVRESNRDAFSSNNNYMRTGIMPRGLYDIRLKLEVFSKIMAFSPDYVFCVTNQDRMEESKKDAWEVMVRYVMYSLADYLRLPNSNCRCLTRIGFSRNDPDVKPNPGLIKKALGTLPRGYKYKRSDLVVIGANSGYANQSDTDREMARRIKVDYIDIQDLLVSYN